MVVSKLVLNTIDTNIFICHNKIMKDRIDFTTCQSSGIYYGGSEKKEGIIFQGKPYMLKFVKRNSYGECFNDVAEYICSQFFNVVGVNAQDTLLGIYQGDKVVACRDFNIDGYKFNPFSDIGESSLDDSKDRFRYRYQDIEELIKKNKKLKDKETAKMMFWKTYIIDALLANPDRHGRNWGFLKKNNEYFVAPVFDNGSSLFSGFSDEEEMEYVVNDKEEILERVYESPRSLILYDTTISDYYSVISSLEFDYCNKALLEIFPLIDLDAFNKIVDNTDLSDIKRKFIKLIVKERYERILKYSFLKLSENGKNN